MRSEQVPQLASLGRDDGTSWCHNDEREAVTKEPVLETPDGRYIVVRGRLWRKANPALSPTERERLTKEVMDARREVGAALRAQDDARLSHARVAVHTAKCSLGERGPVWWADGVRDYTRFLARNTPYASWYRQLELDESGE